MKKYIDIVWNPKQELAYSILMDDVVEDLLFGGAARGSKTWLGCTWEITQAMKYPGTRYFVGRVELKRLKQTVMVTFFKVAKYYKIKTGRSGVFYYNDQASCLKFANGSVIDFLELKYLPSDPLYERYGSSEYTQGWIEEAGEVHFGAYDVLKTRVNQWMNDELGIPGKLLLTSNPKKNWLYTDFYMPSKKEILPPNLAFIQAFVTDNYFVQKGTEERLDNIKIKSQRERLRYGNWEYSDEPDQLIPYDLIYGAVDNKPSADMVTIKNALGVDVARFGDDDSVIIQIQENILNNIWRFKGLRTNELAEKIMVKQSLSSILDGDIKVDGDGIGGGVLDYLNDKNIKAMEIHSGGKPSKDPDKMFGLVYANIRTQLWYEFKEMLEKGNFGIDKKLMNTDEFDMFVNDVTAIKYKVVQDKTIALEPKSELKKRIGRSPDVGDSVVYGTADISNEVEFCFALV